MFKEIQQQLRENLADAKKFDAKVKVILKEITKLEKAGTCDAKLSWQGNSNQYLYLIFPMKDGKRERRYIGRDEMKQKTALADVERWEHVQLLKVELEIIENKGRAMETSLRHMNYSL